MDNVGQTFSTHTFGAAVTCSGPRVTRSCILGVDLKVWELNIGPVSYGLYLVMDMGGRIAQNGVAAKNARRMQNSGTERGDGRGKFGRGMGGGGVVSFQNSGLDGRQQRWLTVRSVRTQRAASSHAMNRNGFIIDAIDQRSTGHQQRVTDR